MRSPTRFEASGQRQLGIARRAIVVLVATITFAAGSTAPAPSTARELSSERATTAMPDGTSKSARGVAMEASLRGDPLLGACPVVVVDAVLEGALPAFQRRIADGGPIKIVTLGSSSTSGSGASATWHSYPSHLAVELLHRFPGREFEVVNTGVGGQEIWEMAARIERDVLAHGPDLVIWQFGSNSAIRRRSVDGIEAVARDGARRILASGADLILMDLQRVPVIEASPIKNQMLALIHQVSRTTGSALFRRYELMKAWQDRLGQSYSRMFAGDQLHMNDTSYFCMAASLAQGIHRAVSPLEPAPPRRP